MSKSVITFQMTEDRMHIFETVGLDAVLQDPAFQAGLKRYADGVSKMDTLTDDNKRSAKEIVRESKCTHFSRPPWKKFKRTRKW